MQATSNWLDYGKGALILEHEENESHFAAKHTNVTNNKSNILNKIHESNNEV